MKNILNRNSYRILKHPLNIVVVSFIFWYRLTLSAVIFKIFI
jgi:hypothetical protein